MKKRTAIAMVLSLSLGLVLALVVLTAAQGPEPAETSEGADISAQNVGGLGLADPPPSGLGVLYMFTGVANDSTGDNQSATTVHCTNFGSDTAQVEFQFFDFDATNAYTITRSIALNQTVTISTQNTHYREDGTLNTGAIQQGSGRVLADQSTLICTAQVLTPYEVTGVYSRTLFITELEMFRP